MTLPVRRVVFFNAFANGDLHVSRGFVRHIMKARPDLSYAYMHYRCPYILRDIPGLKWLPLDLPERCSERDTSTYCEDDTLYINTWYMADGNRFGKRYGYASFDVLYDLFDEAFGLLGVSLTGVAPLRLFPEIDYTRLGIADKRNGMADVHHRLRIAREGYRRVALISSGDVTSGQAENFDLVAAVYNVSTKHKDTLFILTSMDWRPSHGNIIRSSGIVQNPPGICDLNEVSWLSTQADVIVGRASGPFTFAMTQTNLFERDVKWLCFVKSGVLGEPLWLADSFRQHIKYRSEIEQSPAVRRRDVASVLDCALRGDT